MPLPRLEIFTSESAGEETSDVIVTDLADFENIKLNSYEQGYLAGWDDGSAAAAEGVDRAREELARSLQKLAFTWEEARSHILANLEPLLQQLVAVILPEVARDGLALWVLAELLPKATEAASHPPRLLVSPADRPHLEELLTAFPLHSLAVQEEAALASGQIRLSLGSDENRQETEIDLATCLTSLQRLIRDHVSNLQEKLDG